MNRTAMSEPEEALIGQLRMTNPMQATLALREFVFAPPRKFRFDFAWPVHRLAVEVDGGSWTAGRHTSGVGFERDCEKSALAAIRGWRVIHVTPRQIDSGQALAWVEAALAEHSANL